MALAPARPCPQPGCPLLNCTKHQVPAWGTRTRPPITRIRGRQLQQLRAALFARSPWCVLCAREGRRTKATIRDHTIPLAEGGRDHESNTQAICDDCSRAKTHAESARGRARQR